MPQTAPDFSISMDSSLDALIRQAAKGQSETEYIGGRLKSSAEKKEKLADWMMSTPPPAPPELSPPIAPPSEQKQTSGFEAFGQIATVLAAAGGLLSRAPLTASLKAASGAMDAYRKAEVESYNRSYAQWKRQSEYASEITQWQLNQYKAAMDKYHGNFDQTQNAMSMLSAANNDWQMYRAIQTGDLTVPLEILRVREAAHDHYLMRQIQADRAAAIGGENLQLLQDWKDDHPGASPEQVIREWNIIKGRAGMTERRIKAEENAATSLKTVMGGNTVSYMGWEITPKDVEQFQHSQGSYLLGTPKGAVIKDMLAKAALYEQEGDDGSPSTKAETSLPAEARARLKEGVITTFTNKQKWTLKNGKPERVE